MDELNAEMIQEIVQRTVATSHPEKIILFGSRARGDARPASDLDLLVIANDLRPRSRRAADIYRVLSDILFPMDIVVYQPAEIEEWQNVPQAFVTTAVHEGTVLYEN